MRYKSEESLAIKIEPDQNLKTEHLQDNVGFKWTHQNVYISIAHRKSHN